MSKISRREYYLSMISDERVEWLIGQVRAKLAEMDVPDCCSVDVYKNCIPCCGASPGNVTIEMTGPDVDTIRALDLRFTSKILEICEKMGIDHHAFGPLEII